MIDFFCIFTMKIKMKNQLEGLDRLHWILNIPGFPRSSSLQDPAFQPRLPFSFSYKSTTVLHPKDSHQRTPYRVIHLRRWVDCPNGILVEQDIVCCNCAAQKDLPTIIVLNPLAARFVEQKLFGKRLVASWLQVSVKMNRSEPGAGRPTLLTLGTYRSRTDAC